MLASRLKELRLSKKLTQIELSEILNISNKTISDYELNKCCPDYDTLVLYAKCFNVSIDYLLGLTDSKNLIPSNDLEMAFYEKKGINKKDIDEINSFIEFIKNRGAKR